MENLAVVMKAQINHKWATSLDLKDAYLHVPIFRSHQKWLRFHIAGQAYAFRCLPFGLSTAPRVFTRIVKEVGAFLRRGGVQIFMYLDDWLILAPSQEQAIKDTSHVIKTIERLGFIINKKKSHLEPSRTPIFLGARLDLVNGVATPSEERIVNLI
jgi:hypothetical protein